MQNRSYRLILVGGFLGAGKTTLISALCRRLIGRGANVGVITNDQAENLIDTISANSIAGAAVDEISGGCFCCKLPDFVASVQSLVSRLDQRGTGGPSFIVAEPVGSCTDLMATVLLPLEENYNIDIECSPLTVVLDARRALASFLGRRTGGSFAKEVTYIYRKQVEEAQVIVVNKLDLIPEEDRTLLDEKLRLEYPGKEIFFISARDGRGVAEWTEWITTDLSGPGGLMDVDYDVYAKGEEMLGWLNARAVIRCPGAAMQGDLFLSGIARAIAGEMIAADIEVAHLKISLETEDGRLGIVNQVDSGFEPEISRHFDGMMDSGLLTLNIRAEGEPDIISEIVRRCLPPGAGTRLELNAFRPGRPVPVFRVAGI